MGIPHRVRTEGRWYKLYERTSVMITTNLSFSEWAGVFGDAKGPSGINRFDYWDRWRDGVVPFAVEIRALDIEALHFLV